MEEKTATDQLSNKKTNHISSDQKTFCIICQIETYSTRHCYPCYIAWYENHNQ